MSSIEGASWARVTAALEGAVGLGRPAGAWTKYCCPVHEGDGRHHNPSLIVKYIPEHHRTKVQCKAGCDDQAVLDSLGLGIKDLYDQPRTRRPGGPERRPAPRVRPKPVSRATRAIDAAGLPLTAVKREKGQQVSAWKQVEAYPYVREDGTVAGEVIREEASFEHGRDKKFRQQRWDEHAGRMVPGGFESIPFNLPGVQAAIAEGEPVYICEGEKDALTAMRAGLAATTNVGGASSWNPEHGRWLAGATEVVIVVDHDAPGYRRAERVMDTLRGRVQSVRVVEAATGKDLTDHVNAGHAIDELVPVPYLDPRTPTPPAHTAQPGPAAAAERVAESAGVVLPGPGLTQVIDPTQSTLDGGALMGEISGLGMNEAPVHSDEVDHIGQKFSGFMQMLLAQILQLAQQAADRRRREADAARLEDEKRQREYQERLDGERKAIEVRLAKMAEHGWERLSRSEIAAALRDAVAWSEDSGAAKQAADQLAGHILARYGVHVDTQSGHVTVDAPAALADQLAAVERDRATANRLTTAQERMVSLVAAEDGLDETKKQALYADIREWQRNPSPRALDDLTKKLKGAGARESVRTTVRFVAVYLGTPSGAPGDKVPVGELGAARLTSPVNELRKLPVPLVDLGEEAKPRVDALLARYQNRLVGGFDTNEVLAQLAQAVAVMTPEDQQTARERGSAIRNDPSGRYKALWPDHVDREALTEKVRMYAAVAPQVEARTVQKDGMDADWAQAQRERATTLRSEIDKAIRSGEGLHPYEKDQLKAVLADIEAGVSVPPEMLFADDKTGAALDQYRTDEIARGAAAGHRRQIEAALDTAGVPRDAVRQSRQELTDITIAQSSLAAGRSGLATYEQSEVEFKFLAKLDAAGVPEQVRNRIRKELDRTSSDSASTGKHARQLADRWADRRDLVAARRAPDKVVAYDSAERRSATEAGYRAAGLNDKRTRGRMAADAGHAHPAQAAVNNPPGGGLKPRTTPGGSGVYRTYNPGRGDQRGYGK